MEQEKTSLTGQLLIRLTVCTGLITIVVILLYALRYYVAAAVVGTATGALYLLLIVLVTTYVTRRNTIETMRLGAEIALRAQQINDSWDAKKTASMTQLVREGIRLGVSNSARLPGAALPLPGQVSDWLMLPSETPLDVEFSEDIDQ
jgi:hypothetical protein